MALSTMSINAQASGMDESIYYTDGLRNMFEDALTWLIVHPKTTIVSVDPGLAYRFEADFYGLLNHDNIPFHLHHLIMRMTGFTAPEEATAQLLQYLKPDFAVVQTLVSLYRTGLS